MANKTLLPPTATKLEKNLSQAIACEPPIPLRSLWDPQTLVHTNYCLIWHGNTV
jgi:Bacteriophage P2-related tail formation protein